MSAPAPAQRVRAAAVSVLLHGIVFMWVGPLVAYGVLALLLPPLLLALAFADLDDIVALATPMALVYAYLLAATPLAVAGAITGIAAISDRSAARMGRIGAAVGALVLPVGLLAIVDPALTWSASALPAALGGAVPAMVAGAAAGWVSARFVAWARPAPPAEGRGADQAGSTSS